MGAVAGVRTYTAPALLSIAWADLRRPLVPVAVERALSGGGAVASRGACSREPAAVQWAGLPDKRWTGRGEPSVSLPDEAHPASGPPRQGVFSRHSYCSAQVLATERLDVREIGVKPDDVPEP